MTLALLRLYKIWTDPGPQPLYHRGVKSDLRREWPLLHDQIAEIVDLIERGWAYEELEKQVKEFLEQEEGPKPLP